MNIRYGALLLTLAALSTGCRNPPGKHGPAAEAMRPDQVLDFPTLYKQNCAACHGDHGSHGAAISLADPAYLAFAGVKNLKQITAEGVPHTLMPGFGKHAGGNLTDQQIAVLGEGMVASWGDPTLRTDLPYTSSLAGDPRRGEQAFQQRCARCHGSEGTGDKGLRTGSLVDPAYLALISDQGLRSVIVAGRPADNMPALPGPDQDITDITAWLASHRIANPGQPYPSATTPRTEHP